MPAEPPSTVTLDEEGNAQRSRLAKALARLVMSLYRAEHPAGAPPLPPPTEDDIRRRPRYRPFNGKSSKSQQLPRWQPLL
jgi:hypothetical protein